MKIKCGGIKRSRSKCWIYWFCGKFPTSQSAMNIPIAYAHTKTQQIRQVRWIRLGEGNISPARRCPLEPSPTHSVQRPPCRRFHPQAQTRLYLTILPGVDSYTGFARNATATVAPMLHHPAQLAFTVTNHSSPTRVQCSISRERRSVERLRRGQSQIIFVTGVQL